MEPEQNTPPQTTMPVAKRGLDVSIAFIVSSVLLIIALFIGGIFLLGGSMGMTKNAHDQNAVTPVDISEKKTTEATEALKVQSDSDELADIDADLSATDLKTLDGIDQIQ